MRSCIADNVFIVCAFFEINKRIKGTSNIRSEVSKVGRSDSIISCRNLCLSRKFFYVKSIRYFQFQMAECVFTRPGITVAMFEIVTRATSKDTGMTQMIVKALYSLQIIFRIRDQHSLPDTNINNPVF